MVDHFSTHNLSPQLRSVTLEGMNHKYSNETEAIKDTGNIEKKTETAILVNQQKASKEQIQEVVEGLNQFLQPTHTSIHFEYHEKLEEYYVKVVDEQTDEVIKEVPSKKLMDMYATMLEFVGLMVDEKI